MSVMPGGRRLERDGAGLEIVEEGLRIGERVVDGARVGAPTDATPADMLPR